MRETLGHVKAAEDGLDLDKKYRKELSDLSESFFGAAKAGAGGGDSSQPAPSMVPTERMSGTGPSEVANTQVAPTPVISGGYQGSKKDDELVASSKKLKTNKQKVDVSQVIKGLRQVPVEQWKYKDGVSDEGEHIGPYAEDMQKQFGDSVAPGGKAIDIVSALGVNMAAVKNLDQRLAQLEKKGGKR